MKRLTLLAAAALSCCTYSNTYAQVQILRTNGPFAASKFVSDPNPIADPSTSSAPATIASDLNSDGDQLLPNPFDDFADELPTTNASQAASQDQSAQLLSDEQSLSEEGQTGTPVNPQDADAAAADTMPSGRHHRHQHSVVDSIIDHTASGSIAHASDTPIYWGGAPQTPNPVADWLLREECVAGLWDGYPQQRAAECAHMWSHLSGHSRICGGGCGTVAGQCNACAEPRVRNRYLSGPTVAVDTCAPCDDL